MIGCSFHETVQAKKHFLIDPACCLDSVVQGQLTRCSAGAGTLEEAVQPHCPGSLHGDNQTYAERIQDIFLFVA
jgi:hypothetical protein